MAVKPFSDLYDPTQPGPVSLADARDTHEARSQTNVAITGGAIDGVPIGGSTPAAGSFTTLGASGNVTFSSGTIDGVTIGGTTPAAGTFDGLTVTGTLLHGTTTGGTYNANLLMLDDDRFVELRARSGTATNSAAVVVDTSTGRLLLRSTEDVVWQDDVFSATELMRLKNNGNLGVGVSNPAYKVDVDGDVNVTGDFRVNGTPFTGGGGVFSQEYDSGEQIITSGGLLTLPHGLGVEPKIVVGKLICKTAEHGFSVGQSIFAPLQWSYRPGSADQYGATVSPDATNIRVRYGRSPNTFNVHNWGSGVSNELTNANWRLRLWGYA